MPLASDARPQKCRDEEARADFPEGALPPSGSPRYKLKVSTAVLGPLFDGLTVDRRPQAQKDTTGQRCFVEHHGALDNRPPWDWNRNPFQHLSMYGTGLAVHRQDAAL
jgi:hypothetical protein